MASIAIFTIGFIPVGGEIVLNSHDENKKPPAGSVDNSKKKEEGLVLPKIISFESLARCGDEIWIENDGQIYRLRRTKQGKLLLTK